MTWPPVLPPTRTLVIAGLVVLGVALAVLGGWVWWDAHQRRVLEAYAGVMARIQPGLLPDASADARTAAAKELEQVLERYPSARTVPEAAYELGNVRFASGQYAPARAAYELALQRGPSGLMRSLVRTAMARTWEAERDFGGAAQAYGTLVKELDPRSFLYEEALMDQARCLEMAGKKDEAIAAYERLLKEVPTAKRAEDVRTRLASLGTATR
jgi:tetratricopeptide (TPR) repeat protein